MVERRPANRWDVNSLESMTVAPQPPGRAGGRLLVCLRETPATVPALLAVALFVVWAGNQAGYPVTHWAPGGLIVLALLAMTVWIVPPRLRELAPTVRIALGCLAAYTVLSFLSILWAGTPGDAWEGADRTLLYLLVFALFVGWRQRGASAAILLVLWTLAMTALSAYVAAAPGGRCILGPAGPAARRAARLSLRLSQCQRGPVADGLLAGAPARAQRPSALGCCEACSAAVRYCSPRWRC